MLVLDVNGYYVGGKTTSQTQNKKENLNTFIQFFLQNLNTHIGNVRKSRLQRTIYDYRGMKIKGTEMRQDGTFYIAGKIIKNSILAINSEEFKNNHS